MRQYDREESRITKVQSLNKSTTRAGNCPKKQQFMHFRINHHQIWIDEEPHTKPQGIFRKNITIVAVAVVSTEKLSEEGEEGGVYRNPPAPR